MTGLQSQTELGLVWIAAALKYGVASMVGACLAYAVLLGRRNTVPAQTGARHPRPRSYSAQR